MATTELKGVRAFIVGTNKVMKDHRIAMQQAIAEGLTKTRLRAEEYIIENTTGKYNPYHARKEQPSVSGRLTSRTGKLKLMLKNGASSSNPLKNWTGFGNKIAKQSSVALHSMVRAEKLNRREERYIGTIRVLPRGGDPRLFSTVRGQPQESLQTLVIRFNWEFGIRGGRRPIFAPVASERDFQLRKLVEQKNAKIWRLG